MVGTFSLTIFLEIMNFWWLFKFVLIVHRNIRDLLVVLRQTRSPLLYFLKALWVPNVHYLSHSFLKQLQLLDKSWVWSTSCILTGLNNKLHGRTKEHPFFFYEIGQYNSATEWHSTFTNDKYVFTFYQTLFYKLDARYKMLQNVVVVTVIGFNA